MSERLQSIPSGMYVISTMNLLIYQDTGENVTVVILDEDVVELPQLKDDHKWRVSGMNG